MKNENLIHIKFEYGAAISSKRDILSTEMDLLKINQSIKRYREYRIQELEIKLLLEKKLRALKLDFGRLQNLLPEVKIPEILEKAHKKIRQELKISSEPIKKEKVTEEKPKDELESQLQEIQNRLKALSNS
ncbi:hypothetical protein DRN73_03375 [Candidatus Pacearchaeota archaeon]|nr:MAG: hypothetical protein DRN73_03375 [Candidatus Pacearchaeota archaeon]